MIGTDAFQEADIRGITMPITKHNFLVTDPADIPRTVAEAFYLRLHRAAGTGAGRRGEVRAAGDDDLRLADRAEPAGYRPVTRPHAKQIREAARLVLEARRPVLYVGGGTIRAGASRELRVLAELTGIPVVTTLMARGAFPDSHPQHLGMPGMHGTVAAVAGLQRSDLIISLGARFDDRVTGNLDSFAPGAKVIHADIDPAEIGKNRPSTCRSSATAARSSPTWSSRSRPRPTPAHRRLRGVGRVPGGCKKRYPLGYDQPGRRHARPAVRHRAARRDRRPDAIYVAGVGQHQMWAAHFVGYEKPNTWINSGGLGTDGLRGARAMGAKVGSPDTTVWAIDGRRLLPDDQPGARDLRDRSTSRSRSRSSTTSRSAWSGQWQTLFYNERYSNTDLHSKRHPRLRQARRRLRLRRAAVRDARRRRRHDQKADGDRRRARGRTSGVHRDAMVWPMVAAGTSNDDIKYAARPRAPSSTRTTLMSTHTLSVLVENKPGVLARIAGLFSRARLQHRLASPSARPSTPRSRG
jgi:acetolactate synthase-1/2/3 large subunit